MVEIIEKRIVSNTTEYITDKVESYKVIRSYDPAGELSLIGAIVGEENPDHIELVCSCTTANAYVMKNILDLNYDLEDIEQENANYILRFVRII